MRQAGILLSATSLPGPHGIGTLGAGADLFLRFLARAGQSIWQVLPLSPTSFGDSPYQSPCSFAGNPLLLDLDLLVAEGLLSEAEAAPHRTAPGSAVRYDRLYRRRLPLLRTAAARFLSAAGGEFDQFCSAEEHWLHDYALYAAAKAHFGELPFYAWPDRALVRRDPAAVAAWAERLQGETRVHCALQYLFSRQWGDVRQRAAELGVQIMGDLPIYCAEDSADVWANPAVFNLGAGRRPREVAGCPPDYFSADGQRWGNPLYRWGGNRRGVTDFFVRRIVRQRDFVDVLRIDHFRAFDSYYAIPRDEPTARNSTWKKGPGTAFFKALRRQAGDFPLVAEDLGLLFPSVGALLERTGIPGMKVLQFAFDGDPHNPYLPHNHTEHAVVYTGTHDNDTLRGFLASAPDEVLARLRAYFGGRDLHRAMLLAGQNSVADRFVAPMQDYLKLGGAARLNTPGTLGGNWRWRVNPAQLTDSLADDIRRMTAQAGRM